MKSLVWVGSSRSDLRSFPVGIRRHFGFVLRQIQGGELPAGVKRLRGSLRDVLQIAQDDASGTYRLMCTLSIGDRIYVIHAFQKKAKQGRATPKGDLAIVSQRFKHALKAEAEAHGG